MTRSNLQTEYNPPQNTIIVTVFTELDKSNHIIHIETKGTYKNKYNPNQKATFLDTTVSDCKVYYRALVIRTAW